MVTSSVSLTSLVGNSTGYTTILGAGVGTKGPLLPEPGALRPCRTRNPSQQGVTIGSGTPRHIAWAYCSWAMCVRLKVRLR